MHFQIRLMEDKYLKPLYLLYIADRVTLNQQNPFERFDIHSVKISFFPPFFLFVLWFPMLKCLTTKVLKNIRLIFKNIYFVFLME